MSIGSFSSLVKGGTAPTLQSDESVALGRVARTPGSSSESLFVVVPGLSLAYPYEVIGPRWTHAANLPDVGTECLVVFDDSGDAWVPLWAGMQTAAAPESALLNARVNRMAALSLAGGQWNRVPFDVVQSDPGANVINGSYVCRRAGFYAIASQMRINGATIVGVALFKNGLSYSQGELRELQNKTEPSAIVVVDNSVELDVGDVVDVFVYVDQTASLVVGTASP